MLAQTTTNRFQLVFSEKTQGSYVKRLLFSRPRTRGEAGLSFHLSLYPTALLPCVLNPDRFSLVVVLFVFSQKLWSNHELDMQSIYFAVTLDTIGEIAFGANL